MKLTRNSKIFAVISIVLTVGYFLLIQGEITASGLENATSMTGGTFVLPIVYGLLLYIGGSILCKRDKNREYRGDLSLLYHSIASVILSVGGILSFFFLKYFGWRYVLWTFAVAWISYLIHWLMVRNNLKGIARKAVFK